MIIVKVLPNLLLIEDISQNNLTVKKNTTTLIDTTHIYELDDIAFEKIVGHLSLIYQPN